MALPVQPVPPRYAIAGVTTLRFIERARNFNLDSGYEFIDLYSGPREAVEAGFNQVSAQGFTASMRRERGPCWRLSVQVGGDYIADRWERAVEWFQDDIRASPRVIALASGDETLRLWYDDVKDKSKVDPTWPPEKASLWRLVSRGIDSFESKRYVVRLRRTFPTAFIEKADKADAEDKSYTTDALKMHFGVPDDIITILPATPKAAPVETAWSWRFRTDDVEINPFKNVATEVREWVFAAWSTILYEMISQ